MKFVKYPREYIYKYYDVYLLIINQKIDKLDHPTQNIY